MVRNSGVLWRGLSNCVTSVLGIINSGINFIFTDGHAIDSFSIEYSKDQIVNMDSLLDYQAINAKYWKADGDLDRKRYRAKGNESFEEMGIVLGLKREIEEYLNKLEHKHDQEITEKTKKFLKGFYANFGLELLYTVDLISEGEKIDDAWQKNKIETWSDRKKTLLASDPRFIDVALGHLKTMSC